MVHWIIDIVLLLILIGCAWKGYRNGLIPGIFMLLALFASLYGAKLVAAHEIVQSPSSLIITVTIRSGIVFSDGSPLSSFRYSHLPHSSAHKRFCAASGKTAMKPCCSAISVQDV